MEYYQWFRLKGAPFQPASPSSAVYFSPTHLEGLTTLEAGLSGDLCGLTLLTGEAGTGKTTLIYSLLQRDYKRVRIAHIDDPKLSFLEMMRAVLSQLNLYSAKSTKLDYLRVLDHLLDLHGKEERIAVIVDEAQVVSDDVLEELRLLSNRSQRDDRCLQLILVGQPELAGRLKKPELRQLNQRISTRGVLKPLDAKQAIIYVECRLSAQGTKCSSVFEPGALKRLLKRSDGIPRKINMLCHTAMVAAFHAGERRVSLRTAKKTAAEYQDSVGLTNTKRRIDARRWVMPGLITGAALASPLLLGLAYPNLWSSWVLKHRVASGGALAQTVRSDNRETRRHDASRLLREVKFTTSHASHPVELQTSIVPETTVPAAPKSNPIEPAAASELRPVPTGPAAASLSSRIQKQTGASATAERRSKITVRYGDTLNKIATRYFGSNSGINELREANPKLTDIDQLNAGQIIYLPAGMSPKVSDAQTATARPLQNAEDSADR
jgi:general secretion pathway protein A